MQRSNTPEWNGSELPNCAGTCIRRRPNDYDTQMGRLHSYLRRILLLPFWSNAGFCIVICCVASVNAAEPNDSRWGLKELPYSENAKLSLALTKKEYFLGENILLHYCLENVGKQPFRIE